MLRDGIRLRAIGDLDGLPEFANRIVRETIEKTKHNSDWNLTLALNYGSRQKYSTPSMLTLNLTKISDKSLNGMTSPNIFKPGTCLTPDLIIRTSGEFRLGNFLLLQAAYSEIYVSPLHWPDFDRTAFIGALRDYVSRERRFGKTSEQLFSLQSS